MSDVIVINETVEEIKIDQGSTESLAQIGSLANQAALALANTAQLQDYSFTPKVADVITKGPWVDARSFPTLAEADTHATSMGKLLVISTIFSTVPAILTSDIKILPGGGFSNAGALSMKVPDAKLYKIFFGAGAVTFTDSNWIKPEWWGASAVASNSANRLAIQTAIDTKNPVIIDTNYVIDDELVIYHNTIIKGKNSRLDKRAISGCAPRSSIRQATASKSIFTVSQVGLILTYVWGIRLENFSLIGASSSGASGLYLKSVAQSSFNNISMYDLDYGIRISYGMLNTFNDCVVVGSSGLVASVYIDEFTGTTTSQVFNNCYFRGSQWAYINKSATNIYTINTVFNDCSMETTSVGGVYLGQSCSATFVNLYAENVPADTLTTTGSIFSLGLAGWNGVPTNGFLKVIGGHIGGGNSFLYTNSAIFRAGTFWNILVDGAYLANATHLLDPATIVSFPIGGLALNDVETVSLSGTTVIDTQIYNSKYITGSFVANSTGNVRRKVTHLDRKGVNVNVTDYLKVTGTGTKINIPITSQGNNNVKHLVRLRGIDGTSNSANGKPFYAEFCVGSLTTLTNLSNWNTSANITSVAISGMNIVLTLNYTVVNPQIAIEVLSEDASLIDFTTINVTA